ncbi:MAG TPA: MBL fold metallo-hydrolase, partial [Vicinamibacterales bacterium]
MRRAFALLLFAALPAFAQSGAPLPPWSRGALDIHQISTGRGNAALIVFPDGTTMLVDAGAAGDGQKIADTDPRPNASRTAGGWIVRYLQRMNVDRLDYAVLTHWHGDHIGQVTPASAASKDGRYKLTGITEVGDAIPIATLIDRGMAYMPPPDDPTLQNYKAFAAGLTRETIRVGANDQIKLRREPDAFANFEVRNVAANGMVWNGQGDGAHAIF